MTGYRYREAADYNQAHKDDPDLWGEPVPPPPGPRPDRLAATITVRFTPDEADAIRGWARASGQTYSEVVREAVARAMRRPHTLTLRTGQQSATCGT